MEKTFCDGCGKEIPKGETVGLTAIRVQVIEWRGERVNGNEAEATIDETTYNVLLHSKCAEGRLIAIASAVERTDEFIIG